ncbi:MAG TPA: hypothetical protein DDY24_12550 [Alcaligenaceae bacterium]|nr:hypothetical protein [Alcaligenaceae bacterium]
MKITFIFRAFFNTLEPLMLRKICVFFLIGMLAGCSGVGSNSPSVTFIAKVNYKDVFERAKEQANYCWRSETQYPIVSQINDTDRTVLVYVTGLLGSTKMAELSARAIDRDSTEVKVAVNGMSIWNGAAVKAMKEAVEFGVPTCTSYMPSKD